jgi:hypothetical protein
MKSRIRNLSIKHLQTGSASFLAATCLSALTAGQAYAEQPPPPCHANPQAAADRNTVAQRGDVRFLPDVLKTRLERMADRPHTYLPAQAFAEANSPSQLFQYYLLDGTQFESNPFSARFPGINDQAQLTATGGNCGLPTIGAVRLVVEPKPGLPTDPRSVRAFIDIFTDLSVLFVINNESGWYEGWMIHDVRVPQIAAPRPGTRLARFGTMTVEDARVLQAMGAHYNLPGRLFTTDGNAPHFPSASDRFPERQTNVVPIQLSMGAVNCLQQSDCHGYWEFNYTTNWIHPLYELPFTGGIPGTYEAGKIGGISSIIPGSGPAGISNNAINYGDNPNNAAALGGAGPRDPDRFEGDVDKQRENRQRFIPSGLAHEIYLDTYVRLASFEPGVPFPQRLYDAYAAEVKRVDANGDGVISAIEGDVDTASDGFPNNDRLFLPATSFRRFAVTREINDGFLAPRFAPSQRAWVLTGFAGTVSPAVPASQGRDGDDR